MEIVIFGGTTEGRILAENLRESDVKLHICVATAYGASLLPSGENITIHKGRMQEEEMRDFLLKIAPSCCLDATHPYAAMVTENLQRVCGKLEIPYIRICRQEESLGDFISVENTEKAAEFLSKVQGNIFLTTGSKELYKYTIIPDYQSRCFARVLPAVEVLEKCKELGFEGRNLIAMQGPFSEEMNYAMLKQTQSEWMVTKNSGKEGGYHEKCEAAIRAGVKLLVVERPVEIPKLKEAPSMSLSEAIRFLQARFPAAKAPKRKVFLVSVGPGNPGLLTQRAIEVIKGSDVLIGAQRMLSICREAVKGAERKPFCQCYRKEEIADFLKKHTEYGRAAILYSGDIGFYSGARGIRDLLSEFEIEEVSGISSVVYFLNKLGIPLDETELVSCHGQQINLIPLIKEKRRVCALLGEKGQISRISAELLNLGLKEVRITIGERLSYKEERIVSGKPSEMKEREFDSLSVVLFENPHPVKRKVWAGVSDGAFLRGRVPMTKEEIRALCLSKLRLTEDSIVYDVGAGTGSVSVEAAQLCTKGRVYAIEQKKEAIELIGRNKRHFQVENLEMVEGTAPECLKGLPVPTHVFVGGSGGFLPEIIEKVRCKNPDARFVVSAVTLETIAELKGLKDKLPDLPEMEMIQVNVARGRAMGAYHMLEAENPVMIAAF